MRSYRMLPEGYKECVQIDLQKDQKLAFRLNLFALACMILMIGMGIGLVPGFMQHGFLGVLLSVFLGLLGMAVYIVLHEIVHGIFMYLFSGVKPRFGLTVLYAYAGSEVYFCKVPYIVIALAPVVIWGILLFILCVTTYGTRWFWPTYFVEVYNVCGAVGDYYVTWKFLKMKKKILVRDTGDRMTAYEREC